MKNSIKLLLLVFATTFFSNDAFSQTKIKNPLDTLNAMFQSAKRKWTDEEKWEKVKQGLWEDYQTSKAFLEEEWREKIIDNPKMKEDYKKAKNELKEAYKKMVEKAYEVCCKED